jgi:8-amino-7-oxononanoate synthase
VPAALAEPPRAEQVAAALAELVGCRRGLLATSTLHLFHDLFVMLAEGPVLFLADSGLYPVVRWGIERAVARGVPARSFAHHDVEGLERALRMAVRQGRRPVVVTDGLCPGCGQAAPLMAYLERVRPYGGLLVADDTQGLGVLGVPASETPYGDGGGGTLRWAGVVGEEVVLGASLAKGFGVPLAVLASGDAVARRFELCSETRVHSSPPSLASIHAASRALAENAARGDELRRRLAGAVEQLRRGLRAVGLRAVGGWFPVQRLAPIAGVDAVALHERLRARGLGTVLTEPRCAAGPAVTLLVTAAHEPEEINRAVEILAEEARVCRRRVARRQ